jgi:hypothetical protein
MQNNWQKIEGNNLPDLGVEVICFNKEWIDQDFNPNGTRIGFRLDDGFVTAYWWDYQDTYMTISKEECIENPAFSKQIQDNTEPTHFCYLPRAPIS